jgi:hypothetical protein
MDIFLLSRSSCKFVGKVVKLRKEINKNIKNSWGICKRKMIKLLFIMLKKATTKESLVVEKGC